MCANALIDFVQVAKLWRDAPENPNRGKTNEKSKPVDKENAPKKPRGKKSAPVVEEETDEKEDNDEEDTEEN